MRLVFDAAAWADYLWWQDQPDGLERVNRMIENATRTPFKGLGKPEPLKGNLTGWWSRRITVEHRMVYRVSGQGTAQSLEIAQLRYHY